MTATEYGASMAVVNFAPNAYGEVSQAGSYASNLEYHPNGSIQSLTYGNDRVYTTTQNSRRLPERAEGDVRHYRCR